MFGVYGLEFRFCGLGGGKGAGFCIFVVSARRAVLGAGEMRVAGGESRCRMLNPKP